MRWHALALCVLLSTLVPAQGDANAKEVMLRLQTSFDEIVALGKLAERPMIKVRRAQPVKAAVSVMRFMSKRLRKMQKPAAGPSPEEVLAKVRAFSKNLGDFVKAGGKGIDVGNSACDGANGLKKEFFSKVKDRLYVQVAYDEVKSFLVDGRSQGTYDGMFVETTKYGRDGAKAMLDLFTDIDQSMNVRSLAGEGVAQLGGKDDIEAVKEIHADDLEDPQLRNKSVFVLARIGDKELFNKQIAQIDAQIKTILEKLAEAGKVARARFEEHKKLAENKQPSDEEKKELEAAQKAYREAERAWVNLEFAAGRAYDARARNFLEIRDHKETEVCYSKVLTHWGRIEPYLQNPQGRSQMNLTYYNLACVQSLQGKKKPATDSMDDSFRWGYRNWSWLEQDGDLNNIKGTEAFKALVADVKSGKADTRWKAEAAARAAKKKAAGTKPTKPSGTKPTKPSGTKPTKPSGTKPSGL